ncbi:MAG: hypothetical protein QM710_05910 [Flavobacterium sp.]
MTLNWLHFYKQINHAQMDYKILQWSDAIKFKQSADTQFIKTLEYNSCSLYQTKDSSFLVTPLNPFGNCIITKDKTLIDKWINEEKFPSNDNIIGLYEKNKQTINQLLLYKKDLKEDLLKYIFNDNYSISDITADNVNQVYISLKEKSN